MKDITLYHGSKGGIVGNIEPNSRIRCDFGKGFYMGTKPEQAKTLVYHDAMPIFYTMQFELSKIPKDRILTLKDMPWALYVLYNRGRLETIKNTDLYQQIATLDKNKDVIIGPIADDNMNQVMRQFENGDITDKVLLECIRCINYGTQYVAKTKEACNCINIQLEENLDMSKYDEYQRYTNDRRAESIEKVKIIKRQYRGEGKYLDEILNMPNNQNILKHTMRTTNLDNKFEYSLQPNKDHQNNCDKLMEKGLEGCGLSSTPITETYYECSKCGKTK